VRCLVTALLTMDRRERYRLIESCDKAQHSKEVPKKPMSRFKNSLDQVRVAAPCNVGWESMFGNERVRFCGQCQLNVYNLSEMTKPEAERLISQTEGRLCIRYYQRKDGSVITQNCPVGLRAIKRRLSRVATAIGSSVLSFFAGVGVFIVAGPKYTVGEYVPMDTTTRHQTMGTVPPVSEVIVVDIVPPPVMPLATVGELVLIEPPKVKRRRFSR
jgi:hypothetical protein